MTNVALASQNTQYHMSNAVALLSGQDYPITQLGSDVYPVFRLSHAGDHILNNETGYRLV